MYQRYISDLSGIDTKAHDNDTDSIIEKVRDWLKTSSRRANIPSAPTLKKEYRKFKERLPELLGMLDEEADFIMFNDFCQLVEETVRENLISKKSLPER